METSFLVNPSLLEGEDITLDIAKKFQQSVINSKYLLYSKEVTEINRSKLDSLQVLEIRNTLYVKRVGKSLTFPL